jgi:prepilin-type processing-associated H-X9-DG protein
MRAFTMVEMMIVVGIIVLLASVVGPALSKARALVWKVECGNNMRNIGLAMNSYVTDFNVYPPAYVFACPYAMVNRSLQHWTDLLSNRCPYPPCTFPTPSQGMIQPGDLLFDCPSFERGGLPPANTIGGKGANENTEPGQTVGAQLDRQALRTAYTVNEAICPRPYMQKLWCDAWPRPMPIPMATRPYQFVLPSQITSTSSTILMSEWNQDWKMLAGTDPDNPADNELCMSYSTVHGFACAGTSDPTGMVHLPTGAPCALTVVNGTSKSDPYDVAFAKPAGSGGGLRRVRVDEILADPPIPGANLARPNWLGRNHLGKTNFAYVDGHVESKTIESTLATFEWGERFYSLSPGDDITP